MYVVCFKVLGSTSTTPNLPIRNEIVKNGLILYPLHKWFVNPDATLVM